MKSQTEELLRDIFRDTIIEYTKTRFLSEDEYNWLFLKLKEQLEARLDGERIQNDEIEITLIR